MLGAVFFIVFGFVAAEDSSSFLTDSKTRNDLLTIGVAKTLLSGHIKNITPYIDKDENVVRMPVITQNGTHKQKKKLKKSPKSTIQKIIKKNSLKYKIRKLYYQKTNKPTTKIDYDKYYGSEDQNYERTTPQPHQRKRAKKYGNKVARYHLPFQNSQMRNRRHKRDLSRELFPLNNYDEAKFIKRGEDYDVVKTNVKKSWSI